MDIRELENQIFSILVKYKIEHNLAKKISDEILNIINPDEPSDNRLVRIYIDGGSRGNPGIGAAAFIIYMGDHKILEGGKFFKEITNNEAEYSALLLALENIKKLKIRDAHIFTDSELLTKQINKEYSVKSPKLLLMYQKSIELMNYFRHIEIKHIPREENSEADRLVNLIINSKKDYIKKFNEKETSHNYR
ncbi:MAG: ribonuclease HI family protein [Deltaproteobacteria bacterium]|nr:ribonuclease HI family protein [Deltaproteobacteria bacterium]